MKTIHNPRLLRTVTSHPFFQEWLGDSFADRIIAARFEPGEVLIHQGIDHSTLYLLLEGKVSVSALLPNGKRRILRTAQAPDLLGEMELLELTSPPMTVRALVPCLAVLLPYAAGRADLIRDPAFLRKLAILLGRKEQKGVRDMFRALSYPLENRLARFVLDLEENGIFRIRKVEAADSLGVSYRHYSQVLGDFVEKGYLAKEGFDYPICDRKALEDLAGEMET